MNSQEIEAICTDRLGMWTKRLVEQHSTPLILLGVGHDQKSGQLTVCTLEEMSNAQIQILLAGASNLLTEKGGDKH